MTMIRTLLCCGTTLLFTFAQAAYAQQGFKSTPVFKGSTTSAGQTFQFPHGTKSEFLSAIVEIAPGGESGWHMHPVPLYLHILEGTLTLEIDGQSGPNMTFQAGMGAIEPILKWHNGKNIGTVPLRMLAVYAKDQDMPGIMWKK